MSLTERLAELVAFDTQNPMGDERPIVAKLARELRELGAAEVVPVEMDDRHAYVYARFGRGTPRLLLNVHVDTVPAPAGYSAPPHTLVTQGDRLHGLGAADTKGAIAAMMEALTSRRRLLGTAPGAVAVLFSGDEEREGRCIRAFLASPQAKGLERAIVCEPTGLAVGWRHRGIAAFEIEAAGPGGHSSRVDHLPNPLTALARAAVALDDLRIERRHEGPPGYEGLCLNVAIIEGGVAFNVVPPRARLAASVRPAPGVDMLALLAEAERRVRAATAPHPIDWRLMARNPWFATRNIGAFEPLLGPAARTPVELAFWTEAARLSESGIDAVVFGPGRIAQAHAADEYVTLSELQAAQATFEHVLDVTLPAEAPR